MADNDHQAVSDEVTETGQEIDHSATEQQESSESTPQELSSDTSDSIEENANESEAGEMDAIESESAPGNSNEQEDELESSHELENSDSEASVSNAYAEAKGGDSGDVSELGELSDGSETSDTESDSDQPKFEHLDQAKAQFAKDGQSEMPFALVQGQAMTQLPLDLYIPPDALEVILEQFEGPLDLLLYLIRKQNLDILQINVADITDQYVGYVEMMMSVQLELAGDYLVMAAMLAEIKSRMLLPRNESEDEDEEADPRAELIRRLQEYERFKTAAEDLDEMPRLGRDTFEVSAKAPEYTAEKQHPDVDMKEIILAFAEVLKRAERFVEHEVAREALSTRERMSNILDRLKGVQFAPFVSLFNVEEGRNGVVTTFLAVLELIKEKLVDIVQTEEFGPIHVKVKENESGYEPEQVD